MSITAPASTANSVEDAPPPLAVSYLRVSTREQAERGGTDEGFSIPAQREANTRKADELGARIVREFVDAGESARSADRDGLQEMLALIAATRAILHRAQARPARPQPRPTTWQSNKHSWPPVSPSSPPRSRSTRPRQGCSCTASCRPLLSSTAGTSLPRSRRGSRRNSPRAHPDARAHRLPQRPAHRRARP